jgi:hypothetical protein
MSQKKLLVVAALGTVLVAPAFAQQAPDAGQHRRSTVPPGGIYYYQRVNNAHPGAQWSSERRKTNHKNTKHARHHPRSAAQK